MTDYSKTSLHLSNKGLTELPKDLHLYTQLEILDCRYNQLTSLDHLPISLKILQCEEGNPLKYDFEPTLENIQNYNQEKPYLLK